MIYLDNAATTKIRPEVLDSMIPYLTESYGNPGGLYKFGRDARDAIENARIQVANFLHTTPEHIVFTSGGSEGNNLIIKSISNMLDKKSISVSAIEHDSILNSVDSSRNNFKDVSIICPCKSGSITPRVILDNVHEKSYFLSVMFSNNETGVVNDIKEISKIFKNMGGVLFHSDCVQAAGNYDINVDELGLDFATISSHKIYGPKGVGAIYVRDRKYITPIINGGSKQEFGLRGGTENVAGIVGFGKACELSLENIEKCKEHYEALWDAFIDTLIKKIGRESFSINGTHISQNKTVNIRFHGVDAQSLILSLDNKVCISAGSACSSMENKPSHVLKAMGLSDEECFESVRVSFSIFNTVQEVIDATNEIADCVNNLICL